MVVSPELKRDLYGMFLIWLFTKCTLIVPIMKPRCFSWQYLLQHSMGKKIKSFFSETTKLIESKLYMNYKVYIFFIWISILAINRPKNNLWFLWENVIKIYFLETTETSLECSLDGRLETTENPDWSKTKFTFWVIWQENCYKFFFSSPGQRPCELLPSLGVRRPS